MKKFTKKITAILLAASTMFTVAASNTMTAFAANYSTNYSSYNEPESNDFAYWNGSKVVKGSGTTKDEIKWMQASLNYCIVKKGLNASKLDVDGSFGPSSQKTCKAFQKKYGLSQDGSFGPSTISKMKSVITSPNPVSVPISTSSKSISVNWTNIGKIGAQTPQACMKYACAYARTIQTGSLTYASKFGSTATCVWGNYFTKYTKTSSTYFKYIYDCINSGKPVVIHVKGNGSTGHYVTVYGYKNVTNTSNLKTSNFLIIDPVYGSSKQGRLLSDGNSGGYSILDYNCYICKA